MVFWLAVLLPLFMLRLAELLTVPLLVTTRLLVEETTTVLLLVELAPVVLLPKSVVVMSGVVVPEDMLALLFKLLETPPLTLVAPVEINPAVVLLLATFVPVLEPKEAELPALAVLFWKSFQERITE